MAIRSPHAFRLLSGAFEFVSHDMNAETREGYFRATFRAVAPPMLTPITAAACFTRRASSNEITSDARTSMLTGCLPHRAVRPRVMNRRILYFLFSFFDRN